MKWMAFQKAISVDISHISVAESIKLDAMGMCDVCDMYVSMYVCSYHVLTSFFMPLFLIFLLYSHMQKLHGQTCVCTYVHVWIYISMT